MGRLEGKIALITGAANGIGLAAAELFVGEGAKVFLVDRDREALAKAAESLGSNAGFAVSDVSEAGSAETYVAAAVAMFGRIDIAILNAGVVGRIASIEESSVADFDRVMAVNVRGVWLGLAGLIPVMKKAGGSIVLTASTGGLRGSARLSPYVASKHAVIGLAKTAALELAPYGIRVNAVCPASTGTSMMQTIAEGTNPGDPEAAHAAGMARIPLQRYGTTREVAQAMLYLASDESSFVTGATHLVDGGAMAGSSR